MAKRLVALGLCLFVTLSCTRERIVYVEKPDEEPDAEMMELGEAVVLEVSDAVTGISDGDCGYEFDLSELELVNNRTVSECRIEILSGSDCDPDLWALNVHTWLGDQVSFDPSWMGYGCHPVIQRLAIYFRGSVAGVRNYIDSSGKLTIWGRYQTKDVAHEDLPTIEIYRYDPRYREAWVDLNPWDPATELVADADGFYTLGRGGVYRLSASGEFISVVVPQGRAWLSGLAVGRGKIWTSQNDSMLAFDYDGARSGAFHHPAYLGTAMTFFDGDLLVSGQAAKQNFIYVLDADSSVLVGEAIVKRIITGLPGPIRFITAVGDDLLVSGYAAKLYLVDQYGLTLREYDPPITSIHGISAVDDLLFVLHSGAVGYSRRGSAISRFAL